MGIRYLLLPYIYTTFHLAHSTGSTVMRALAWEFPNEPNLASADRQFLLGDSLMITPVLAQGASTVDGVFPGVGKGENWYDWYNQSAIIATSGQNVTIEAPLGHIPVFVRGGSVLPTQEPGMTTRESRAKPWGVIAAKNLEGKGSGTLYVDDGESLVQNGTLVVEFTLLPNTLHATTRGTYKDTNPLANITIIGARELVNNVSFNGVMLSSGWAWNETSKVLNVNDLANPTAMGAWASDWVLSWN